MRLRLDLEPQTAPSPEVNQGVESEGRDNVVNARSGRGDR